MACPHACETTNRAGQPDGDRASTHRLYPENTGWRRETGELLIFDLEFVGCAPRFYDIAGWLGAPNDIEPLCRPREELAQYYLEQYTRWGGVAVSLNKFLKETYILWMVQKLDMDWRLGRALDGCVDWTEDREEGRRVFRYVKSIRFNAEMSNLSDNKGRTIRMKILLYEPTMSPELASAYNNVMHGVSHCYQGLLKCQLMKEHKRGERACGMMKSKSGLTRYG